MQEYLQWVDELQHPHHQDAVKRVHDAMVQMDEVIAVLLGGSLSHGYERIDSDIDLMIIVADDEYAKRLRDKTTHYLGTPDMTPYDGGYVDGKFIGMTFFQSIADRGNDATRFAYCDAQIIFTRDPQIIDLLQEIGRYPIAEKESRMERFYAQFSGWRWFANEAERRDLLYLKYKAITQMAMFGGRMILVHNHVYYPYHKALPYQLEKCSDRPTGYWDKVNTILADPRIEEIESLFQMIKMFVEERGYPTGSWVESFIADSETHWFDGTYPPIDDL